jgi:hypothetical protein
MAFTMGLAISLLQIMASCSGANFSNLDAKPKDRDATKGNTSDTPTPDGDGGSIDAPVWINGATLTCDWNSINSDEQVSMDCGLQQNSKSPESPKDTEIHSNWVITDATGKSVSFHKILNEGTPFDILVTMVAASIPGSTISVWIAVDNKAYEFTAKFDDILPGLKDGGALGKCFLDGRPFSDCFKEANISIPNSGPVIDGVAIDTASGGPAFLTCPPDFVQVATVPPFCVAKYEMKQSAAGSIESSPASAPMLVSNAEVAASLCKGMGVGFDLISNDQWMDISREIENQPENWSARKVGAGALNRGHSDASPDVWLPADTDDRNGCFMTSQICDVLGTFSDQRRTLILSNGQIIWDFAGNAAEILDWVIGTDKAVPLGGIISQWTELNQSKATEKMPASKFMSENKNLTTFHGIGGYYSGDAAAYVNGTISANGSTIAAGSTALLVVRGGSKNEGLHSGIYALAVDVDPNSNLGKAGFRCSWQPALPLPPAAP